MSKDFHKPRIDIVKLATVGVLAYHFSCWRSVTVEVLFLTWLAISYRSASQRSGVH